MSKFNFRRNSYQIIDLRLSESVIERLNTIASLEVLTIGEVCDELLSVASDEYLQEAKESSKTNTFKKAPPKRSVVPIFEEKIEPTEEEKVWTKEVLSNTKREIRSGFATRKIKDSIKKLENRVEGLQYHYCPSEQCLKFASSLGKFVAGTGFTDEEGNEWCCKNCRELEIIRRTTITV